MNNMEIQMKLALARVRCLLAQLQEKCRKTFLLVVALVEKAREFSFIDKFAVVFLCIVESGSRDILKIGIVCLDLTNDFIFIE